jgi:hypothetical protein
MKGSKRRKGEITSYLEIINVGELSLISKMESHWILAETDESKC